uniref:Retrovirus-related Pol polyprotein from transposon TNT 1-94 n=1 Tax=Cajanus cajan TaxID=3821 RepID=A0A151RNT3_CAJCA|nr:hypothetical protein KK1_034349 [Cajanus cajan]
MADSRWRQAMLDEMDALQTSGTWELVPLPPDKSIVGCQFVIGRYTNWILKMSF